MLDARGALATYERRCVPNLDRGLLKPEPTLKDSAPDSSTVWTLVAPEGSTRSALNSAVLEVLHASLLDGTGGGSPNKRQHEADEAQAGGGKRRKD